MAEPRKDQEIIDLIKANAAEGMEELFRRYYRYVAKSVYRIIPDATTAEDVTQEVFYELWRKRDRINITTSVSAYLRRSAVNRALNHLRKRKMLQDDIEHHHHLKTDDLSAQRTLEYEEVEKQIQDAIDRLPNRCRLVFTLSRYEEKSYKEIAADLDISVKTVENQISKALRILRAELGHLLR